MSELETIYGELGIFKRAMQTITLEVLDEKISLYTLNTDEDFLDQLCDELSFHVTAANELVFTEDAFKSILGIMKESVKNAKFNLAKQVILESVALSKYTQKEAYQHIHALFNAKEIDIENECKNIIVDEYQLDVNSEEYQHDFEVTVLTLGYYLLIGSDNIDFSKSAITEIEKFKKTESKSKEK